MEGDENTPSNNELRDSVIRFVKRNLLMILSLIGVIIGISIGLGVRVYKPSDDVLMWIGLPGDVYMRMLKMMILPLIISTVITGTASLNPRSQGRISAVSVGYIFISNSIAPIIGVIIVLILNPGSDIERNNQSVQADSNVMETQDIFADLIRNLFPDNVVLAAFQQTITKYDAEDGPNNSTSYKKYVGSAKGTNVLGLIICCTLFGIGTSSVGKQAAAFLEFFKAATEVILRILRWLVWFTPVGIASLIAAVLAKTPDLELTFRQLGMFILAALLGLVLFMFLLVPLVYLVLVRKSPLTFFINLLRPLMITFISASSAIAIPETLYCMERLNGIDKRVSRFVVPFSSALNKPGSALFIAASCLFICQLEQLDTDFGQLLIIIILTSLSTFAVPSVPSAGIVTILILLTAMNIPAQEVGLLMTVEWFLDRCRTAANIYGQNLCVAITQKFSNLLENPAETPEQLGYEFEIVVDGDKPRPKITGSANSQNEAQKLLTKDEETNHSNNI